VCFLLLLFLLLLLLCCVVAGLAAGCIDVCVWCGVAEAQDVS
jgi:hypothetical protein